MMLSVVAVAVAFGISLCGGDSASQRWDPTEQETLWEVEEQAWYVLYMQGIAAGTLYTATMISSAESDMLMKGCADENKRQNPTARYKTIEDMSLRISRGNDDVNLKFFTEMTELGSTGEILHCGYTQQMAQDAVSMSYTFSPSGIKILSEQGGRHTSSTQEPLVYPADVHIIGRKAARDLFLSGLNGGNLSIRYSTLKPEMGTKVLNVVSEFQSFDPLNPHKDDATRGQPVGSDGSALNTSIWLTTMEGLPIAIKEWVDGSTGSVVRMVMDTGTGPIEAHVIIYE